MLWIKVWFSSRILCPVKDLFVTKNEEPTLFEPDKGSEDDQDRPYLSNSEEYSHQRERSTPWVDVLRTSSSRISGSETLFAHWEYFHSSSGRNRQSKISQCSDITDWSMIALAGGK
jgi:hypothetical protein